MPKTIIWVGQELSMSIAIIGHQGPLKATDPDWKGSTYNVQVGMGDRGG